MPTSSRLELADVIKSRDVEDPVNLHVHRPLQLVLTRVLVKTKVTPNQITLASLGAGLGSAALIVEGTPIALLGAAFLLFSSAILDGVDGMIARSKKMSSELGHALDGAADYLVNVTTTAAASWHLAVSSGHSLVAFALGLATHLAWAQHLMLYDFHSATYLRFLTGGRHQGGDLDRALALRDRLHARGASPFARGLASVYAWQLGNRQRLLERISPAAARHREAVADVASGAAYVERHRPLMRAFAWLGNAPHMDLMTLATATGHFEIYFVFRIVFFSALAVFLSRWHRRLDASSELPSLAHQVGAAP